MGKTRALSRKNLKTFQNEFGRAMHEIKAYFEIVHSAYNNSEKKVMTNSIIKMFRPKRFDLKFVKLKSKRIST